MNEEQIRGALREVLDPELGINIVDLGLLYGIVIEDSTVRIALTMTTRACPLHAYLTEEAQAAVRRSVPEATHVDVQIVWDPPWSPAMMSDVAKQQLGWR